MTFISNIQQKLIKKIHSCEHELLKRESNVTILIYSRFILDFILDLDYF